MSVIFIALPVAIVLAAAAVAGFMWAVKGGQFDDLDSPAWRMVVEDDNADRVDGHARSGRPTNGA